MNGSGTFRFHKFSEEENKSNANIINSKNYFNSKTTRNYQKIRTLNGFQANILNTNKNFQSYQFKTKYSALISNNYLKSLNNNNNITNNLLYSENNKVFPYKKLINIEFDSIIYHGDLARIDKLLPQMIYLDLDSSFSNNNHLQIILKNFQMLLRLLFNEQEQIINKNNMIEDLFNNEKSNINKKKREIEKYEYKNKKILNANQKEIGSLVKKITIYKNILISTGKEKLIPNKRLLNAQKKNGFYICQLCPAKTFTNFEDIQKHYIKNHFNYLDNIKNIYHKWFNNINEVLVF